LNEITCDIFVCVVGVWQHCQTPTTHTKHQYIQSSIVARAWKNGCLKKNKKN